MSTSTINGKSLKEMLLGGATMLSKHIEEVNDLNVFPVPDGDTGTNMMKTLRGGIGEISELDSLDASVVLNKFSHGAMFGASGNSGVILSRFFAGMSEAVAENSEIDVQTLVEIYKNGKYKSTAYPDKKAYPNLPHPPILPKDYIGDSLETDPHSGRRRLRHRGRHRCSGSCCSQHPSSAVGEKSPHRQEAAGHRQRPLQSGQRQHPPRLLLYL